MATPKERLEELRTQQGSFQEIDTPRQKLEKLRIEQGDTNGEGQGNIPSTNPVFEAARNNAFLKGYLDQAAGINQLLAKFKSPGMPGVDPRIRELQGFYSIDDSIKKEEEIYQKNRKKDGLTGFDWKRLAGNIASPVSVATAMLPISSSASMASKVAKSAGVGLASGVAQPVLDAGDNFNSQKALQGALGLGIGAVAPPVMSALKGVFDFGKFVFRPMTARYFPEVGKRAMLGDMADIYKKLVGKSKQQVINSLDDASTIVPHNKPTSGLAIAEGNAKFKNAGNLTADEMIDFVKSGKSAKHGLPENFGGAIVKLEKELSKLGMTGDDLKTIHNQHTARRSGSLAGMIDSSDSAIDIAIAKRAEAVKPLYEAVEMSNKLVRTGDVLKKVRVELARNANEDAVTMPLKNILRKLKQGNIIETNPQRLYSLSKDIKRMIESKTPGGGNEFNVSVLSDIKKTLDNQIGKAEPSFAKAQHVFKEHSKPINQMQVSREFGKALEDSLKEEGVNARPFVNAMDNAVKTLKKSTGFPRFKKLEDVMNPKQMKVLNNIKSELVREQKAKTMTAETNSSIGHLKDDIEFNLPNMLSRPMMLANAGLRLIGRDMSPEYEKLAVQIQKDPKLLSKLLKMPDKSKQRMMVVRLLERYSAMIPAQELSREEQILQNKDE